MADKLLRMTLLQRGSFTRLLCLALGRRRIKPDVYLSHAQVSAATNTAAPALPSGLAPVSQLVVGRSQSGAG